MRTLAGLAVGLALSAAGCASYVDFASAPPRDPVQVPAVLYRPAGAGPFPALVLLHGCGGVQPYVSDWAKWLEGEGYVALVVETLSPRGLGVMCGVGSHVGQSVRDAIGALAYLRSRPFIDGRRVAVVGWSSGGMAALRLASTEIVKFEVPEDGFRVAVAFYPASPHCEVYRNRIPVLLLLGGADEAARPGPCIDWASRFQREGRPIEWKVYPGVHHSFDMAELGSHVLYRYGYTQKYDAVATRDAQRQLRDFLGRHLRAVRGALTDPPVPS